MTKIKRSRDGLCYWWCLYVAVYQVLYAHLTQKMKFERALNDSQE